MRSIAGVVVSSAVLAMLCSCGVGSGPSEATMSATQGVAAKYNWLQFGGGSTHSGNNTSESIITPSNVAQLNVLFQAALPGNIEGAPVVLTNVSTPTGTHDVAYVTTKNGYIVALDAYLGTILWSAQPANNSNITMSSPAIDPSLAYVYSSGLDGYIHKYAVGTGVETTTGGWPELLTLKGNVEKDGTAITIGTAGSTSYLYMGTGGYDGDGGDYQGHVTTINLSTGAQTVFNALCSNQQGTHFSTANDCSMVQSGVWAKAGVTFDPLTQMLYVGTGNGLFSPSEYAWGDSILKLNPNGTGGGTNGYPVDSYTPSNFQTLQNSDLDLGSTNTLILANQTSIYPHLACLSGKDAVMRLINLDNMSGQGAPGNVAGEVSSTPLTTAGEVQNPIASWVNPADGSTWVFVVSPSNGMSAFRLAVNANGEPSLSPEWSQGQGGGGAAVIDNTLFYAINSGGTGTLESLSPTTGTLLWSSATLQSIHWQTPMAANGVLYVGDNSSELTAFSLETPLSTTGWTATASLEASSAANAVDDPSLGTRWTTGATQAPGQWFELDLGSPQPFNVISINAGNNTDMPAGYAIYVSNSSASWGNDGATWGAPIATGTGTSQVIGVGMPQVTAQYIQVQQTANTSTYWWSIANFSLYNGPLAFGSASADAGLSDATAGADSTAEASSGDVAASDATAVDVVSSDGASADSTTSDVIISDASGTQEASGTLYALSSTTPNAWVASASVSAAGSPPSNVLEGSENTRWTTGEAQAAGQWFQVNMLEPVSFSQITIDAGPNTGDYPRGYTVYVSNTGASGSWTPIASGTGSTQLITVTFAPVTAQYIQVMQMLSGVTTDWWSITELTVYSANPPPGTPITLSTTGWTATASLEASAAVNAIGDPSLGTRWTTGQDEAPGQWFELDLGSPQAFNSIAINAGNGTDMPAGYAIYVSNNSASWGNDSTTWGAPIATGTSTSEVTNISFPQVTAQYIQVQQTGTSAYWWSIANINLYAVWESDGGPAGGIEAGAMDASSDVVSNDVVSSDTSTRDVVSNDVVSSDTSASDVSSGMQDGSGPLYTLSPTTPYAWVASASASAAGSPPSNALEGSENVRWTTGEAQAAGQWFQVNMLAPVSFSQVTIDAGPNTGDYPRGYTVYVSNTGASGSWAPIASGAGSTQLVTVTFAPVTAQYIQVMQTLSGATTAWWSITEFTVYSANPPPGTPITLSTTGWTATASLEASTAVDAIDDPSLSTRWTTGQDEAPGQWFELNLGSPQTFNSISINAGNGTDMPAGYAIYVSNNSASWGNDGTAWGTPIATGTSASEVTSVSFPQVTAQYIQVQQTGTSAYWWSIANINVSAAYP